MRCTYCDSSLPDDSLICPICGFGVAGRQPRDRRSTGRAHIARRGDSLGLLWYIALALLTSALLSATVVLGLLALEHGLDVRRARASELGQEYYRRGVAHLEEGNYLLALAEFKEAVRLDPHNSEAREQLGILQELLGEEVVSSVGVSPEAALDLYGEAWSLHAQGQWSETIVRLEELRDLDPTYRKVEVEEMLLDAYHRQSMLLLDEGELEKALSLLDRALEMGEEDPQVSEIRYSLSLYLSGLSQWGVDWERVVEAFQVLYEVNPRFLDVETRFHDALIRLGDLYHAEGAWCMAESQYAKAVRVMPSEVASDKRDEARDLCVRAIVEATPTVDPSVVLTETITATVAPVAPPSEGSFVGEFLGQSEADDTEMSIRVCVVSLARQGVPGAGVEISAQGWRSDPRTTDADGCCEFAGLTEELEFTVELTDLPSIPVQVVTRWGTETLVNFVES